jgi:hypothetical protein
MAERYLALVRPDEAMFLDMAGCGLVCSEHPVL